MKLLNYLFFSIFGSVLECCELTGVSLLWTRMALANKAKIGLVLLKLGIYHGVYFDCIIIINLRGYIDLLDTSVIVFVNNLLWFEFSFILFIHHNIHIYFELCTYCKNWDIYLSWNMNSVKYLLFYMELFCDMFGSVLECYELTHISWCSLIPRQDHASLSTPQLSRESCKSEHASLPHWLCNQKHPSGHM